MAQNRNKLIELFIGNISNAIVHKILEKAIDIEEIRSKYNKEIKTSFDIKKSSSVFVGFQDAQECEFVSILDIAKHYRDKINPIDKPLSNKDIVEIKRKIINNVKSELQLRISKGYKNIKLDIIEETVNTFLNEMKISEQKTLNLKSCYS